MVNKFHLKGYTVITSLSHALLGELKKRIAALEHLKGSSRVFIGAGAAIADFPLPEKTILVLGCTQHALFDDALPPEEKAYRKIFGDRVMMEVQGYVRKIPDRQVSFRDQEKAAGDQEALLKRIEKIFDMIGISLSEDELNSCRTALDK